MKKICFALLLATSTLSLALVVPQGVIRGKNKAIRIKVRSADPYAVVAMLQGQAIRFPELSTLQIPGLVSLPNTSSIVFKGKFTVNPTDNSIWFWPDEAN